VLDDPGSISGRCRRFLAFPERLNVPWDPSIPLFILLPSFFPGVKRLRREIDHSPPASEELKNEWRYTSSPVYTFMMWTGTAVQVYRFLL
jgi:hypothetical protein